jgi:hypothetical protein
VSVKTEVLENIGSPGRSRTCDILINSQALYQLSYRGTRTVILSYLGATLHRMPPDTLATADVAIVHDAGATTRQRSSAANTPSTHAAHHPPSSTRAAWAMAGASMP